MTRSSSGDRAQHDIPSLDGLRALSILIVILSHIKQALPTAIAGSGLFRYIIGGGLHGVQVFFVISGYLITTLLLREFDRFGTISLRRFYARRSLRIFPPFYAYLAVLAISWISGIIPQHRLTFLAAATYTIVYLSNPTGWYVQHAWSLSIEEQFYLLWPAILLWLHRRRRAIAFAVLMIAIMPIARFVLHLAWAATLEHASRIIVLFGSADTLMVGCLLALLKGRPSWEALHRRCLTPLSAVSMVLVGFLVVPYLSTKLTGHIASAIMSALGNTVTSLCIGGVLLYVVENPTSLAGRLLNLRLVRHIGVISYSLYVWQQFFTSPASPFPLYRYLFILAAAEASFWLIERPLIRVRKRLHR
jgi:peptidoglycan/LPS O-acetylase OafA/YrhL